MLNKNSGWYVMSDDDFDDELLNKELEASIESALIKAAEDAANLFSLEVSEAIRSLSDIRDVTNARILRDTKVASARIASNAEVQATALLAAAESLRLNIQRYEIVGDESEKLKYPVVKEFAQRSEVEIRYKATVAIEKINAEADVAIAQISTKQSIDELNRITDEINTQIEDNAVIAKAKLEVAHEKHRTSEAIVHDAVIAADKITTDAAAASQRIKSAVTEIITKVSKSADDASANIAKTVAEATSRIISSRDKALARVEDFLKERSKH